jgi:serine/threonine protein kinase/WD40 repeat protein
MIGTTLFHYRITEKLGAGGMGEVYRAEDANLDRQVAIKVLPDIFSGDPERLARFEREAKLLASLNHPNIAAIHGLEESGGKSFLVLELVEGETLAQRIAKGPLPVDETLEVCRQIAEGLEAAHEKGIIHRDLKPANIKITPEGKIKVLDFGLAKAFSEEPVTPDLSRSPTLTDQMTRPGVILGTAAYMSPEQAKGMPVDKRTDIWAFGCLLYECLTTKRAFAGDTVTETLAAILKGEPDWSALPGTVPLEVVDVVRRCLQKDPKERVRDIGDARIELCESLRAPAVAARPPVKTRWRQALPWGMVLVCIAILTIILVSEQLRHPGSSRYVRRFTVSMGRVRYPSSAAVAISPNGAELAYAADGRLYRRPMDQFATARLGDSQEVQVPFFSANSEWLGFQSGGKLIKRLLATGASVTLGESRALYGACWLADDTIVYVPGAAMGLWQLPSQGGERFSLISPDFAKGERSYRWPVALPDASVVLFAMLTTECASFDDARIVAFGLKSRDKRIVVSGGSCPRYAATGHMLYTRSGALQALPFDVKNLAPTGSPKTVLTGVMTDRIDGRALFDVSEEGTLVYVPGGKLRSEADVVWLDRQGKCETILKSEPVSGELRLSSPDGTRLAFDKDEDIWVYDMFLKTQTRITSDVAIDRNPVWSPDGQHLTFASNRKGPMAIYEKSADGTGTEVELYAGPNPLRPASWSPDGKTLAFVEESDRTGDDIWLLSISGEGKALARKFAATQAHERQPVFSPDGLWVAYVSNETGDFEVYVKPSSGVGQRKTISTGGGIEPVWHPKGGELFYLKGGTLMSVPLKTTPEFAASVSRPLFETSDLVTSARYRVFDISRDGSRFVVLKHLDESKELQINIVQNWFEELKRLVPTGK